MYFDDVKTLEELKKAYHKLAMKNHPDRGGDPDEMKKINMEYDVVFQEVKTEHYSFMKKEYFHKDTAETPEAFKDLINCLIHLDGITIEIVGCFVWVGGNTRQHKDVLKKLGFHWSRSKRLWYKSPEGYHRYGKKEFTYGEIQEMYGVQGRYKGEDTSKKLTD